MDTAHTNKNNVVSLLPTTTDIYNHSEQPKTSSASATLSRTLASQSQSLLTIVDKSIHRSRRRLTSYGCPPETFAQFQPAMEIRFAFSVARRRFLGA